MMTEIIYSKRCDKFLAKNPDKINEEEVDALIISALKRIFQTEDVLIDLKKLKWQSGNVFRIRKGEIRIVFSFEEETDIRVFVHDIDFRGNIY